MLCNKVISCVIVMLEMLTKSFTHLTITPHGSEKGYRDPLQHLASEILELIFSQLDTTDVYQCMLVSHQWNTHVPSLSALVWKTLSLHPRKSSIGQSSIPFNQYVQIVEITRCEGMDTVCDYLFALVRWKCNNIHTLALTKSNIDDYSVFLEALKQTIASKLRNVFVEDCQSNLPILDILAICPLLESVYYSLDQQPITTSNGDEQMAFFHYEDIYYNEPSPGRYLLPDQTFEKLKCLSIDWPMHKSKVRSILERCPNLRCVRLANYQMNFNIQLNSTDPRRNAIPSDESCDLDMFTRFCPAIEYIECNNVEAGYSYQIRDSFWWKNYAEINDCQQSSFVTAKNTMTSHHQRPGLRFLKFFGFVVLRNETYVFDDLFNLLEQNQTTLEVLHLETCHLDERSSLLSMPKLRHLICRNYISSLREGFFSTNIRLGNFISHCKALERIEFNLSIIELIDDPDLPRAIAFLPSLKTLVFEMPRKMDGFEPRINNEGVLSILYGLGEPGILCKLEKLIFGKMDDNNIFTVPRGYVLTSDILYVVSRISSLRSIHLHHDDYYNYYTTTNSQQGPTEDALAQFMRNTSNHLERVSISNRNITPFIYQEMGKMTALQELQLCKYAIPSITPENMDLLLGGGVHHGIKQQLGKGLQHENKNKTSSFKRLVIHCIVNSEFTDPVQKYTSEYLENAKGFYKIQKHGSLTFVKI
ncbi:hypothetical protein BDA99DRAFT_579744 [Phascolomyces articulosus]|uniref:F-box domain-containing protein n=1 Tax=Phascolomyces articulosus TaxID=60185 RepID=A0AAD5K288_9FUNG|nr:hypothetical protein BDA99DRAFT_579744 [Phascolomyces articulosus]